MSVLASLIFGVARFSRPRLDHLQRSKTERLQFGLFNKVLHKSGSSQDLPAWLQNEGAQVLLYAVEASRPGAYNRILSAIQAGLPAFLLGIGIMAGSTELPAPDKSSERAIAASIDKRMELAAASQERRAEENVSGINALGILFRTGGILAPGALAGLCPGSPGHQPGSDGRQPQHWRPSAAAQRQSTTLPLRSAEPSSRRVWIQ